MFNHQELARFSAWAWPILANHLWQATLVSLVALAAAGVLRRGTGGTRYILLLIGSAAFVVPSGLLASVASRLGIGSFSLTSSGAEPVEALSVIYQFTTPISQSEQLEAATSTVRHSELFCLLTTASFFVSIILLARWWIRRQLIRSAIKREILGRSTREHEALQRVRVWLGIKRRIRVSILPGPVEPGVWGVMSPVVLLPATVADELTDAELEAVMMHELIHVARWDNLIANLHRLLCCLFWFHPLVWMIDHLLLRERERACDEEVLRLGGASDVYAASLVKVLRFCLGWSVAGSSNASGSNLGRRLERIMSKNVPIEVPMWHRVFIGSVVVVVIALSSAAGLLNRNAVAQNKITIGGVSGGISGGVPGGVPGGIPGGVAGGIPDSVIDQAQENLIERLDQASEMAIQFRNSSKAPLTITEAHAKAVIRKKDEPGDEFAVWPIITVVSNVDRRIKGIAFELRNGLERRGYYEFISSGIAAHGAYTSARQRRIVFLPGDPSAWSVRIAGVLFEDGDVWGTMPPPPPPPPPPVPPALGELRADVEHATEVAIQFKNAPGTPLSITSAAVRAARIKGDAGQVDPDPQEMFLIKPNLRVINNTSRSIASFVLEFTNSRARILVQTRIEPNGSATVGGSGSGSSAGAVAPMFTSKGNHDQMEVTVLAVRFEDGEIWGEGFPPPPPPLPPVIRGTSPDSSKLIRKSGGVMMASATHRVNPDMPPLARAAQITGSVVVEVTVDEAGSVIAARSISGHPLLKDAAVDAARQWKFAPTMLSGEPVRVVGLITLQFEP